MRRNAFSVVKKVEKKLKNFFSPQKNGLNQKVQAALFVFYTFIAPFTEGGVSAKALTGGVASSSLFGSFNDMR